MDIVMKITRSEYRELKRAIAELTTENSKLKSENDTLKKELVKAVEKVSTERTETKKKGANKE